MVFISFGPKPSTSLVFATVLGQDPTLFVVPVAVELPAGCPTAWAFATSKRKHESCIKVEESQVPRKDLEQILKNDGKLWQIRGFLSAKSLKVTSHYPVSPEMVAIFDPEIVDQIISPAPVIGRHDGEVGIIRYCWDWTKKLNHSLLSQFLKSMESIHFTVLPHIVFA